MQTMRLGHYLTLEELCTCTHTYGRYADLIDPFPQNPSETIPALQALCQYLLDPVIEQFGKERFHLTYGFCSAQLKRYLEKKDPVTGLKNGRIDPSRDQHMAHEKNRNGLSTGQNLQKVVGRGFMEITTSPRNPMQQVTLIRQTLQPLLDWHGARITFVALFIVALFRTRTVNFAELAVAFMGKAQSESNLKRLYRFFSEFELNYLSIAKLVVALMDIPQPWTLSLDRTTWEFGNCCHNILMLGVVHKGVAFPLFWWMLDKKGNSHTDERIDLLGEFFLAFPEIEIEDLCADREFVGTDWFEYLLEHAELPFRIRIRESDKLNDGQKCLKAKVVFSSLQVGEQVVLSKPRQLWRHWLYVAALRLEDGKLLIVVTNRQAKRAIADYGKRWSIETLFGCFKSRGFRLESTHLMDCERLSRMIALLTIGLCWAFRTGEWLAEEKPIKVKKHGRKSKSIFRYGLDHLRRIMLNLEECQTELLKALQVLSCT